MTMPGVIILKHTAWSTYQKIYFYSIEKKLWRLKNTHHKKNHMQLKNSIVQIHCSWLAMEQYTLVLPPRVQMIRAIFCSNMPQMMRQLIMVWLFNESSEESRSWKLWLIIWQTTVHLALIGLEKCIDWEVHTTVH